VVSDAVENVVGEGLDIYPACRFIDFREGEREVLKFEQVVLER
jgi:hypothetical protein